LRNNRIAAHPRGHGKIYVPLFIHKKEVQKMLDKVKKLIAFYEEVLELPHRTEIARELRDEDDLFLLMLYSEMIGIPNPVYYYTLELYPYMIEQFHDWHLRMGMEKSPLTGIRCC